MYWLYRRLSSNRNTLDQDEEQWKTKTSVTLNWVENWKLKSSLDKHHGSIRWDVLTSFERRVFLKIYGILHISDDEHRAYETTNYMKIRHLAQRIKHSGSWFLRNENTPALEIFHAIWSLSLSANVQTIEKSLKRRLKHLMYATKIKIRS